MDHAQTIRHSSNYLYLCECMGAQKLLNIHRVVVKRYRKFGSFVTYNLSVLLVLFLSYSVFFSVMTAAIHLQWFILILGVVSIVFQRNAVTEEAVIVMPTFGVQLETSYCSGKVQRQFVPLKRILAAVINEAVTPTSCYFYLALLLHDDSKLVLAFKEVQPPLCMLVPIWKALCSGNYNLTILLRHAKVSQ